MTWVLVAQLSVLFLVATACIMFIMGALQDTLVKVAKGKALVDVDTLSQRNQIARSFNEHMVEMASKIIKNGGSCSNCGQPIVRLSTPNNVM